MRTPPRNQDTSVTVISSIDEAGEAMDEAAQGRNYPGKSADSPNAPEALPHRRTPKPHVISRGPKDMRETSLTTKIRMPSAQLLDALVDAGRTNPDLGKSISRLPLSRILSGLYGGGGREAQPVHVTTPTWRQVSSFLAVARFSPFLRC
jgi:hypothetical protein